MKVNHRLSSAQRRRRRVRQGILSVSKRPRLSVFRSNKHLYLQVIDDSQGKTIASVNELQKELKVSLAKLKKMERAKALTELLFKKLEAIKVKELVFDRGQYRYHGRVKMVAETLREMGVKI